MFKDTDEALARLEAELFMEEAPQEESLPEEPLEDIADYEQHSSSFDAYNTDDTDEDLDDYSEDVLQDRSDGSTTYLILIICFLSLGIVAILLLWMLWFRGVL